MLGRVTLTGLLALVVAALVSSGAFAKTLATYDYNATGIETGVPTGSTSPFAGTALGPSGFALWSTSVPHEPLNPCGTTAITPGGSFTLAGTRGVRLSGTFVSGGSVTAPAGFCDAGGNPPCVNETFTLNGLLTINGMGGTFVGTLTHFNAMLGGNCLTYFATISGHLSVG
jgi:hypothetical protein